MRQLDAEELAPVGFIPEMLLRFKLAAALPLEADIDAHISVAVMEHANVAAGEALPIAVRAPLCRHPLTISIHRLQIA